jgi:hypothetical protein
MTPKAFAKPKSASFGTRVPYCTPISRNWVTRNRAEIGAEAQLTLQGN